MKLFKSLLYANIFLFIFTSTAKPQMIADITTNIETEFGTYHPYTVNIIPNSETYSINDDLGNISNILKFYWDLSQDDLIRLKENFFFVKPTPYKEIYDIYKDCKESEIPVFVTTDAMLHTFHIIYDYALRALEVQNFATDLDNLNKVLLSEMESLYNNTDDDSLKTLILKNVAYFGVATKLKDTTAVVSEFAAGLVAQELELIAGHQGFDYSPIFDDYPIRYKEDYSQYVPRGHYTRNDTLKTYFKSMMWYGRMMFRVEPDTTEAGRQKGREETLQAILIVKALNEATVNGEPALKVWERIYDPTVFFVGKSDDLSVYEYTALLEDIYGSDYLSLNISEFADEEKLNTFIDEVKELRNPLISSSWVNDYEEADKVTKAFRFMGQRFIPDSYMFQQLVYDEVLLYYGSDEPFTMVYSIVGPIRGFPRGLDVMTVLGSQAAEDIIRSEGDADYYGYDQQLDKLKVEFAELDDAVWAQNLYWNWLYALMPLLEPKGEGYPSFMQNLAWTLKQLYTALGSWGELRHDTILYAKQSYTEFATGIPDPLPGFTYGYVEPNPQLFARLASLANLMRIGLSRKGLLLSEFDTKLINFESLLLGLKGIAEKELTNQELLLEEYDLIWTIGERLENLLTFSEDLSGSITDETDEGMAIIADVHTDSNTESVLEEGVGYPFEVYVAVKVANEIVLTRGAGFSYYEFKHPMSDRLTDEAWQKMLTSENPPEIPQWTETFIDNTQNFTISEPFHAVLEEETVNNITVRVNPAIPTTGDSLEISVDTWYCYDSTLTACFCDNDGTTIDSIDLVVLLEDSENQRTYVGCISTSGWSGGPVLVKILSSQSILLSTHWFEIQHTSGITENASIPARFFLYQSYPNPFNALTTIRFDLPDYSHIKLEIF
ncbi:MAG: DUF3160 domain-containing protein, partial [Candidatus Marinimicrobia bacterium]|nr:DUF3160 domain-containing protein [Candidatus Neomarinimicrobiota bacterium]